MEHAPAIQTSDITVATDLLKSPELAIAYYCNIKETKPITKSSFGKIILI